MTFSRACGGKIGAGYFFVMAGDQFALTDLLLAKTSIKALGFKDPASSTRHDQVSLAF